MRRRLAGFLRIALALVGAGAVVFLLAEPHFEGRNVNATVFEVYFKDPFLAYVYVGSIPFFVGLSQGFRVLWFLRLLVAVPTGLVTIGAAKFERRAQMRA